MTPREELDLILKLIRKYNLPLSPILEYAVNEKKEEFPEATNGFVQEIEIRELPPVVNKEKIISAGIEITHEIIEDARTPNGGFTKSQLAAIGVSWPPPADWIKEKVGTFITAQQFVDFNRIEYVSDKVKKKMSNFSKGEKTYKDVAFNVDDRNRMEAVLRALEHFDVPATPRDIARSVSRTAWGGTAREDSVDTILKRLPEVEYIPWGKYILKCKKNE